MVQQSTLLIKPLGRDKYRGFLRQFARFRNKLLTD